jgi:hypothetical protein
MSYDVSEQPAQDHNGWYPTDPPTGPRHRYDGQRRPDDLGGLTGAYPAYQPAPGQQAPGQQAPGQQAPGQQPGQHQPGQQQVPQQRLPVPPQSPLPPPAPRPYTSGAYPAYGSDPGYGTGPADTPAGNPGGYGSGGYPSYPVANPAYPDPDTGRQRGADPQYGSSPGYGWAAATEQYAAEEPAEPAPSREPVTRQHDPAAAELRSQVVRRIRFMNFRHTEHAWERRYKDPIGPHALAFLYSEPARGKPARYTLRTATRIFLAGPEVDDLPRLLHDMADVVGRQRAGSYDPRILADRTEEMSPGSFYVGLAVSSLDTPAGPWAHLRQRLAGSIDVPGRCYALLTDDTMMLMDRGGESKFGHFEVRCTDSLDEIPGDSMQRWIYDRSLRDLGDPETSHIWRGMLELHNTIVGRTGDEQ